MAMRNSPVVSIITPSFNREHLIAETLDSVRAQTFSAWEHVIVDDGSTDDTLAVAQAAAEADPRIRVLVRDRGPKGACTCRNIGVEQSQGKYVLFLDTDDLLASYCLEQRVGHMQQHPGQDFAIFPMLLFREEAGDRSRLWNIDKPEEDLLRVLRMDPVCQGTGTLWKTKSFRKIGGWDEELAIWQDIELHLRAFSQDLCYGKRFDLPPDVYIRKHDNSLSRAGYFSPEKIQSRAEVVKRARSFVEASPNVQPRDVRYLCASVVLSAAKTLNFELVRNLTRWARRRGVLTRQERWIIWGATFLHLTRLTKIPTVRQWLNQLTQRSRPENTIGTVSIEKTGIPQPVTTS